MFEMLKRKIERKDYKLETMIEKIRILFADDEITKEEKDELEDLARENANPENSYASIQEQINNIYNEIKKIKADVNEIKGTEQPTEPSEEYPEYKQPSGSYNAYNTGDKITFNGKKYICKIDGCVWNPETYPEGWEEALEVAEEE